MAQAHDDVALRFTGASGDLKIGGQAFFAHDEGVVASAGGGGGDTGEEGSAVVLDLAGLAVHELWRTDYLAPEGCADGLVPETDAKDRHGADAGMRGREIGEVEDEGDGDAGLLRGAGPGRDEDAIGTEGFHLGRGELVVAVDKDLLPEFPEVLDEVVGEGVVVIEDEDHPG